MSVLPNSTNISPGTQYFWTVDASTITAKSFISDRVLTDTLSTGSITTGAVSTTGSISVNGSVSITSNLTAAGDITALNVTATDTLNSYFINAEYITSYNGANIQNLLLANQIQGSNLVQFPQAILSSICTTSITLDGNTLDTAGVGPNASLLLNGQPIATISTLASSILTWSFYPALNDLDLNNFSIQAAATVQADNGNFFDVTAVNQVATSNIFATAMFLSSISSQITNANLIRAGEVSTLVLKANSAQIKNTLTAQQLDVTTLNATNITTATLVTTSGGSVTADNGNFGNLSVTNSANFSGSRPNFTTGINSSGANNFNNQSIDNAPNINTQGNQSMTIASANGMDLTAPTRIQLLVDGSNDIGSFKPINLIAGNGNRGQVNITGNPGFPVPGTPQTFGEVNIVANGGGSLLTYATGGSLNLTANTGSSPILGTVSYSAIKLNAAGITSYAGFASPLIAVPGYNLIQGSLGIELIAGSVPGLPNIPGTIYLYGATGVAQTTGGIRAQNGLGIDFIVPYPQGFNTQPYDLIISGNPAGQKVTLSNVRILQSDGGTASGFTSMTSSNLQASNIIMFGNGSNNGTILGLSGQEQLLNFSNVSTLNVRAGQGTFFQTINQQVSTQSLFISTINGLPFSAIIAPTIPSTFSDLTTNILQANTISTNSLGAFTIANVSSINGFSIAQLVSSVSPQAPAPSTFMQLFTSSLVASNIQTINISTVSLQAQVITGVSTLNGFTVAQLVSSVSPQAPAPSTFTQLFTSSLVADSITGASFSPGLKLLGNGVTIQPTLDNSITLTTTGVGQVTIVSQEEVQVFAPSTMIFGDLRYTTLFGQPFNQFATSSITATNISVINEQVSGTLSIGGVSVIPQQSTFSNAYINSLSATSISSGLAALNVVTLSTINGYNLNEIINQPVISTFCNIYVSDGSFLNITSLNLSNALTLFTSSINGFNVNQFLSTPGQSNQVSTFNTLNASSFQANNISAGLLTVSTINGLNISQLVNPALSTVSTFAQLFTSSILASTVQTSNLLASNVQAPLISSIQVNTQNVVGVSTINGFTISQFVSSVSPQPPIPSTVNQFFTSSLAANVITNYQNQGVDILAPGYINIGAGTGVNINGDQCNVTITSSNIIENALSNYTNNTSGNWTVNVGCNIVLHSSNYVSLYNTNTAPAVGPNDFSILAQGDLFMKGQANTTIESVQLLDIDGGGGILIESTAGSNIQVLTVGNGKILLTALSTVI